MHEDEVLTDNTQFDYYKQCKACSKWGNGDAFSNFYRKGCCDAYPYPLTKPYGIQMNTEKCKFREVRDGRFQVRGEQQGQDQIRIRPRT